MSKWLTPGPFEVNWFIGLHGQSWYYLWGTLALDLTDISHSSAKDKEEIVYYVFFSLIIFQQSSAKVTEPREKQIIVIPVYQILSDLGYYISMSQHTSNIFHEMFINRFQNTFKLHHWHEHSFQSLLGNKKTMSPQLTLSEAS